MNDKFKNITKKFGWKELVLCLVLAAVVTVFVVVFTGNKAEVTFNSVGGSFDEGEGASIYDYGYYEVGSTDANNNNYHEVLKKTFRISSVATLPDVTRNGYNFVGWFYGTIAEDGTITYGDEFTEKTVKKLEKIQKDENGNVVNGTSVYAKWEIVNNDAASQKTRKENIIASLNITWKGMLGIFLVIGIIFLVIVALNLTTKKVAQIKEKKSNQSKEE